MNSKVKNMSLIIAVAASVYSFNASAAPKIYNGAMCKPLNGAEVAKFSTSVLGGISNDPFDNTNKMARYVSCPIIRENTTNTNGTWSVWVNVHRNSATPTALSCTIISSNLINTSSVDLRTENYTGAGQTWLNLDLQSSVVYGTYSLTCLLPARSAVNSYYVREF